MQRNDAEQRATPQSQQEEQREEQQEEQQQQRQQEGQQQQQEEQADPLAAISPGSDGATVLELLIGDDLAAAAVRADALPGRPIKVYLAGLHAATLEGRLLVDAQGELLATVVRGRSPGVVHVRVVRPHKPARLLARMHWAGLPPSRLWLFPARSGAHDVGGWYVEWEGHGREGREGWAHPAVYVLMAAFETLAWEERREARRRLKEAAAGLVAGWWRQAMGAAGGGR
jgi:hypothetical protein